MSERIYLVESVTLREHWVVKAHTVKGAIVETLSHLKPQMEMMESILKVDIDIDLRVKEIKDVVTELGQKPVKYHL